MKKLINQVDDIVAEALQGMAAAHPDLVEIHLEPNYVVRKGSPAQGKVALVSGGGSGHEPMHGGFVGMGMLSGAGPGAEDGGSLSEVADVVREVNESARSMGMALTSCTVPAAGKPTFDLGDDEMEIGIGIHGEPGRERMKLEPADRIVDRLMEPILSDGPFHSGDRVLAFVNGMGGTPQIELYVCMRRVAEVLKEGGYRLERTLIGSYITSLEMAGLSITLLRLNDELLRLWDAPVLTPGLRWGV